LSAAIADTLERIFGNSSAYRRFQGAAHLVVPAQANSFPGARRFSRCPRPLRTSSGVMSKARAGRSRRVCFSSG
jgi:hypothetical protein